MKILHLYETLRCGECHAILARVDIVDGYPDPGQQAWAFLLGEQQGWKRYKHVSDCPVARRGLPKYVFMCPKCADDFQASVLWYRADPLLEDDFDNWHPHEEV